jgi:hypothetical protein
MINFKWKTKKSDSRATFPLDVIYTRNIKLLFGIQIAEYEKQIFFNFKVIERKSKIIRLFKIPLSPITFKKEYWL